MTPTASYRTVQSGLTLTLVMLTTPSTGTGSTDRRQVGRLILFRVDTGSVGRGPNKLCWVLFKQ